MSDSEDSRALEVERTPKPMKHSKPSGRKRKRSRHSKKKAPSSPVPPTPESAEQEDHEGEAAEDQEEFTQDFQGEGREEADKDAEEEAEEDAEVVPPPKKRRVATKPPEEKKPEKGQEEAPGKEEDEEVYAELKTAKSSGPKTVYARTLPSKCNLDLSSFIESMHREKIDGRVYYSALRFSVKDPFHLEDNNIVAKVDHRRDMEHAQTYVHVHGVNQKDNTVTKNSLEILSPFLSAESCHLNPMEKLMVITSEDGRSVMDVVEDYEASRKTKADEARAFADIDAILSSTKTQMDGSDSLGLGRVKQTLIFQGHVDRTHRMYRANMKQGKRAVEDPEDTHGRDTDYLKFERFMVRLSEWIAAFTLEYYSRVILPAQENQEVLLDADTKHRVLKASPIEQVIASKLPTTAKDAFDKLRMVRLRKDPTGEKVEPEKHPYSEWCQEDQKRAVSLMCISKDKMLKVDSKVISMPLSLAMLRTEDAGTDDKNIRKMREGPPRMIMASANAVWDKSRDQKKVDNKPSYKAKRYQKPEKDMHLLEKYLEVHCNHRVSGTPVFLYRMHTNTRGFSELRSEYARFDRWNWAIRPGTSISMRFRPIANIGNPMAGPCSLKNRLAAAYVGPEPENPIERKGQEDMVISFDPAFFAGH